MSARSRSGPATVVAFTAFTVVATVGCGATEEEMTAKDRTISVLTADLKTTRTKLSEDEARLGEAQSDTAKMREQLKQAGLSPDRGAGDAAKVQQAVLEYKLRAEQVAMFELRLKDLRARLDKLSGSGVKVVVRDGRITIMIPSDLLFDTGRDDLRPQGKETLAQIGEVLRSDKDLANRSFVAAAHTDNAKSVKGGPFKDNLGLSLARARQVMLFMVEDASSATKKGGGGMNPLRWSAAGYGERDPIAGQTNVADQESKEDAQRNRRIELVLQPSSEESLNVPSDKQR